MHLALPIISIFLFCFAWSCWSGDKDFLNIGYLLSGFFSYDFILARNESIWSDYLGALLGVGFIVAGYGTNVGHELIHRVNDRVAMLQGWWLLSASCNADFAIEHVYGHHKHVGLFKDAATARRGESIYIFMIRSTIIEHKNAFKIEKNRLVKRKQSTFSFRNRYFIGFFRSIFITLIVYYWGGVIALSWYLLSFKELPPTKIASKFEK